MRNTTLHFFSQKSAKLIINFSFNSVTPLFDPYEIFLNGKILH